ncbi:MAG: metallophosphoesterase [Roseiflexaceae bacterium]|nr:metallophosphoesterase [Roseiflexaceae bacterium]
MRLAILADIHGNLAAFEAALDHAQRQQPDQIIIAGDIVVGSPDSQACLELAQRLDCPLLRGNHERYVASFGQPGAPAIWQSEQFGPMRWAFDQLTEAQRTAIGKLPQHLRLADCPDLLIVHASLRSDRDTIYAYTPADEVAAMFPDPRATMIVRGHNHIPQVRLWQGRQIVTAGSIGLALDMETTAQYLILEQIAGAWHIRHQSVPYDLEATLRRFREGYLEQAGPIARLYMREVATAAGHLVPFLRTYARWSPDATLPLAQALDRFLHEATA